MRVPKQLAEWEAPDVLPTPAVYRSMTWDELKPPKAPKKELDLYAGLASYLKPEGPEKSK